MDLSSLSPSLTQSLRALFSGVPFLLVKCAFWGFKATAHVTTSAFLYVKLCTESLIPYNISPSRKEIAFPFSARGLSKGRCRERMIGLLQTQALSTHWFPECTGSILAHACVLEYVFLCVLVCEGSAGVTLHTAIAHFWHPDLTQLSAEPNLSGFSHLSPLWS